MTTIEEIDQRIKKLEDERTALIASHERAAQQWQKTLGENQGRNAQITGAITELQSLKTQLNGETK